MAILIKNDEGIAKMRVAGHIVARTHEEVAKHIKAGMTTLEIDKIAEDYIRSNNAVPSFKGYNGFPGSICISINEEIIHGIPSKRVIKEGDIVSVDIGAYINGYHGDAARTIAIGNSTPEHLQLIKATEQSFFEGIKCAKLGHRLFDVSAAIEEYIDQFGYGIVREYIGHGIGKDLHESPEIPNYKQRMRGPQLVKGMCLAIEPMINLGTHNIKLLDDDWTVITKDKKVSAHYENTIVITDGEPEILTLI